MEERRSITLDTKPGASLKLSVYSSTPPGEGNPLSDVLVVFLNGLMLHRAAWSDAISHLIDSRTRAGKPTPTLLTYDRYGQGESDSDPTDPPGTPYGHDAGAVVSDLDQLLTQFARTEYKTPTEGPGPRLVLVCNSIGCPLARLYAASRPPDKHRIAGFIFLDSMMANTDFVSLFPDPGKHPLPEGVSPEDLRHARQKFAEYFHPSVANPERLDRRNLAEMLPHSDKPQLPPGPGGQPPRLVVIGHDWDEFAEQCEKGSLSVSKQVINAYVNPAWGAYNEGLTHLTTTTKENKVKIAKGCGHFIQKDDPVLVATEISDLLDEL